MNPGKAVSGLFSICAAILLLLNHSSRADQLDMQNGDRYRGKVLSLTTNLIVLESEVLGTIKIPRAKVASISFGDGKAVSSATGAFPTNVANLSNSATSAARRSGSPSLDSKSLPGQISTNNATIRQIQDQFLAEAGPEANSKFNELVSGLASGKITMSDLRAQAKTAADQLRELKRAGGDDAGFAVDGYLSILDTFLKEVPNTGSSTNKPGARSKSSSLSDDE